MAFATACVAGVTVFADACSVFLPPVKEWSIVTGLDLNDFSRERIDATVNELKQERDTVKAQGLI